VSAGPGTTSTLSAVLRRYWMLPSHRTADSSENISSCNQGQWGVALASSCLNLNKCSSYGSAVRPAASSTAFWLLPCGCHGQRACKVRAISSISGSNGATASSAHLRGVVNAHDGHGVLDVRKVGGVVRARDLAAAAGAEVGELLQLVRDAELLTLLRARALAQLWIEPRASSSAHCSTSLVSCPVCLQGTRTPAAWCVAVAQQAGGKTRVQAPAPSTLYTLMQGR